MKKQNGITLIALVISIIVMLILAGVSINSVIGDNGVLTKAQNAVTNNKKGTILEEAEMLLMDWQTEYLVNKISYEGRIGQTTSGASVICTGENFIVIDSAEEYIYIAKIDENGQLGEFTESLNNEESQIYKAMHPKIPTGYEYVTGTWVSGYVIKESTTEDEFVWIPVVTSESYSKKFGSKNYHFSEQDAANNGEDLSVYINGDDYGINIWVTSEETEKSIVNGIGGFYVSRYEVGIESAARTTLQSGWTTSTIISKKGAEPARQITQATALELANTWKSGTNVQSGLITGTQWDAMCKFIGWSICDSDCTSWGNYYNSNSKDYGTDVVGHSGASTAAGKKLNYWYTNWETASDFTTPQKTKGVRALFASGSFISSDNKDTSQKNIYDVAGNVWEWTTEKIKRDDTKRVVRGGSARGNGETGLATRRDAGDSMDSYSWATGFRAVLYVK